MLNFFRKNAQIIGWSIVIFFVSTMLSGALFFRKQFKAREIQESTQVRNFSNELAVIGQTPVNKNKYRESLQQNLLQYKKTYGETEIDPEIAELMQYSALNRAIQYTILLKAAQTHKLKVSKAELVRTLEQVYAQYNLKNKKALKKFLKENNYPYKLFIQEIKQDILAQNFLRFLSSQATVTDKDIDNNFTEVNVQHILFEVDPKKGDFENALAKANTALKEIQEGSSFDSTATKYSDDIGTKKEAGSLGWIKTGQTVRGFEDVAFSLEKGEMSQPVKSVYGYHIIKLTDKRNLKRPDDIDYKQLRSEILKKKQEGIVSEYIQQAINQNGLNINEPSLKAFDAKKKGDFNTAIYAYQALISQNPSSTVPHYLLAKVYLMLQEKEKAKKELQKAEIKGEMNIAADQPMIHIYLGNIYLEELYTNNKLPKATLNNIKRKYNKTQKKKSISRKNNLNNIIRIEIGRTYKEKALPKEVLAQYDKALELATNNKYILEELATFFKELKAKTRISKIKTNLKTIKENEEAAATIETEQTNKAQKNKIDNKNSNS
jgi:foldase protein PrsA